MSVLEEAMPRMPVRSTRDTRDKVFVAMHWDQDHNVHVADSLSTLVTFLNDGRRGPSRLQLAHAWDVCTYKARHHKAWLFRAVDRARFSKMVERRGWTVIPH